MTAAEIREAIGELAQEHGWKGPLPEGDLSEAMDSLQRLTLVVALEDRFRVRLDDVEEELKSVDDLVRCLQVKTDA